MPRMVCRKTHVNVIGWRVSTSFSPVGAATSGVVIGKGTALTARELAVLRLLSNGKRTRETAELLGLGEETVRSHLKKAQAKLGVQERSHAIAQAIRLHLIP